MTSLTKEKSEKGNKTRGSGSQSRIVLDFDKLSPVEGSWLDNNTGQTIIFIGSEGLLSLHKTLTGSKPESAKDVEGELRDERIFERFQVTHTCTNESPCWSLHQEVKSQADASLSEDSDLSCYKR